MNFELNEVLPDKFLGILDKFIYSETKVVIQKYDTGELQLVRKYHININTASRNDKGHLRRSPFTAKAAFRVVPKDEREELSRVWIYWIYYDVECKRYIRMSKEEQGKASLIRQAPEFDLDLADDPSEIETYKKRKRLIDRAKELKAEAMPYREKANAILVWLREMVIEHRQQRDKDDINRANQKIIQEEVMREQARAEAKKQLYEDIGEEEPEKKPVKKRGRPKKKSEEVPA